VLLSEEAVVFPRRSGAWALITLYDCLTQFVHSTLLENTDWGMPVESHDEMAEMVTGPWTPSMLFRVSVTQNVLLLVVLRKGKMGYHQYDSIGYRLELTFSNMPHS
jgi:hypothetical protein